MKLHLVSLNRAELLTLKGESLQGVFESGRGMEDDHAQGGARVLMDTAFVVRNGVSPSDKSGGRMN